EAVSWVSGKPYLFNGLFVLLSLLLFVYFLKTEEKKYLYYFLVAALLTFVTEKTRSAALPLLAILSWVVIDHRLKEKVSLLKILSIFGVLFLIIVIILWPQLMLRIQNVNSGVNASDSIFYNPFFQYPTAMAKYLQLIWVPVDLTLYHTMYVIPSWVNWIILLIYLTMVVWFWFKDKKMFFALAFIFLATAPSMAPVKISWLVAERYVFLGSAGFAIFLAMILEKISKKSKPLSIILLVILVAVYSIRVFLRNIDWQTNHKLWVNTCQVSPNSHNAWNNIGDDYDKLGQYENAIKGFTQSTVVKANYADAFHNRANIFYKMGRLDLAQDSYRTALHFNPALYQTYLSLIQIDLMQKRFDLAMSDLAMYKQYGPNDVQTAYVEAVVDAESGKIKEAKEILEAILRVAPDYVQAKNLYEALRNK
ncbi:MAG: tetratricopeptide repeat protein, partial [Candidatus Shapirobacteria bacterium]|nr:tetratricopeptide repeat protein [Candidatus Shapirobacteria bacterium]